MEQQSSIPRYNYDIFLSFRGEDTRYNFTGHLLKALHSRGITTFFDDKDLRVGDDISRTLFKAIKESRISVIVFSENYASSTWCLKELVKILECKKKNNQYVWPIFYKVNPSDLRHMKGSYGKAMAQHESRFGKDSEEVLEWGFALKKVADFSGDDYGTRHESEHEFIDKILKKASHILPSKGFYVEEHVVGVESRLTKVKSILDRQSKNMVCMLGIHGLGGIGKTILAKILYNSLVNDFEYATFLSDVREKSLTSLQERLLSQMFGLDFKFDDVDEGAFELKNKLCKRRVLVMLDNVDKKIQLEKLVGKFNWFGSGSRIIVTTRDKSLLDASQVEMIIYEMKELNDHEASELFCWNAFNSSQPPEEFKALSKEVIKYAKGLPLALKVIGSNLSKKNLVECQSALKQYKKIPDDDIQSILKISYDGLSENGKNIFLDIACFFKGSRLKDVNDIFNACGFFSEYNIKGLIDKSLITIDEMRIIQMHDLIQSMGREVVRAAAPRLGEQSRLWSCEDVVRVLEGNSGTYKVEGIILESPESKIQWGGDAFKNMEKLRVLIVRNAQFSKGPKYLPCTLRVLEWEGYPLSSLPPNFDPKKLVIFEMPRSCFKLEKPFFKKKFESISVINCSICPFITEVPDMSGMSTLKELIFNDCRRLVKVHNSIGFLKKVTYLSFRCCFNLTTLPRVLEMPSLKLLNINGCTRLQRFPDILGNMRLRIWAYDISAKELPASIIGLEVIRLTGRSNIVSLPRYIELLSFFGVLVVARKKKHGHYGIFGTASTLVDELDDVWGAIDLQMSPAYTLANSGFQHRCKGGVLSFWVRNKFPYIWFAFIKENYMKKDTRSAVRIQLFVNNVEVDAEMLILESCGYNKPLQCSPLHGHLIRTLVRPYLVNGWNYLQIKVTQDLQFSSHNIVIKECGVSFSGQANMEDVRFEDPSPFTSAGMVPRSVLERATTCNDQGYALLKENMTKDEPGDITGKLQNSRAKKSWHGGEKCKKRAATWELGNEPPKKLMINQGKLKSSMKTMMLPVGHKRFSGRFLQIHGAIKTAKELHIRKKSKIKI